MSEDNLRFLVVDDEKSMRSLLEVMLSSRFPKAVIDTYADPVEALEQIKNTKYTVVLSDFNMPVMTGFELGQQAKIIQPDVNFVLMSGNSYNNEKAYQLGVNFIKKPFRISELVSILQEYIPAPKGS